jgi:hypothetical protein
MQHPASDEDDDTIHGFHNCLFTQSTAAFAAINRSLQLSAPDYATNQSFITPEALAAQVLGQDIALGHTDSRWSVS